MATSTDIRVLVPRVRRAVEGVGAVEVLTDDQLKDMVADALSDLMLYLGSIFGKTLEVTERDGSNVPTEYATSDELTLAEGSVVAAQAALNYFFFQFSGQKTSETIRDEAGEWSWSISASMLKAQLELLIAQRDKALSSLEGAQANLDVYESFVAVRDVATARCIEPWVDGLAGLGGQVYADYGN